MLYDPTTAAHLKPWLVRTLEPICDAEPSALAEYILALLKHNAPEGELRKELTVQLEEFLEKECSTFVDTLFTALRTKSYLPYSTTPATPAASTSTYPSPSASADAGIPIPLDGLLNPAPVSPERPRKRGIDSDDYDAHGPSKGSRLNNDGQFSRYGRNDRSSWGGRGDRGDRSGRMNVAGRPDFMDGGMAGMDMGMGMNGMDGRGQNYRPPERRGICRDYHNNGYCARGAFCKYSHGEDAVIPTQLFPMSSGAIPFMPMLGAGGMPFPMNAAAVGGAYDPHERMDMRPSAVRPPNGRPSVLPGMDDIESQNGRKPGELSVIQDLTPQVPITDVSPHNSGEGFRPQNPQRGSMPPPPVYDAPPHMPPTDNGAGPRPYSQNGRGQSRGGRGRGGIFNGDAHNFRPEKRNDKTLVVEKIPEDKLTLGAVNDWFSKFGTVTNVAVDAPSSKALVSFAGHDEAYKAWKSEEAVFGNRFVKVFWHRPMEGHGQAGQRLLAASAPLVARVTAQPAVAPSPPVHEGSPAPQTSAPVAQTSRKSSVASSASALAAKQKLLEQQIAEQKSLMGLLSTASPQEKKDIMARLRKLNEEMKPSAVPSTSSHSPPPPLPSPTPATRAVSTPRTGDHERLERERLDKELELHHVTPAGEGEEETTEELKAKLEKLKAEAASLGISETSEAPTYPTSTYRPYRGRARGRSFFRGAMRGGPPRSMKLDLRPKKLLVRGAPAESLQAVRDWYETTGQVESVETSDNGDIVIAFYSRGAAEQGLAKGTHIATVGPVQISWQAGQSTQTNGAIAASKSPATLGQPTSTPKEEDSAMDGTLPGPSELEANADDSHMHEVSDAAGWGAEDDGFGMM
ncbi:hypothetical protein BC628DRAFT_1323183 [Trametes gibbosa]|uniref:RNA-binding protein 27 n=1 Tax=Trametes gibbosa TaxID=160864 RepID=A0A6G6FQN8_9APHY|nr:hypothetical protein BC628DRAFT_1323183 [Trametes gibbosa]QIE48564.1 hypothetical protein [Trametes gibbosa]